MTVIPTKYLVIPNFLSAEENSKLINYAKKNEVYFIERVSSPDYPAQQGLGAIKGFENWKRLVVEKVRFILPKVNQALSVEPFEVGWIECDASAHADDGFLAIHNDTFPTSSRVLSFVYYYHSVPRAFTGGQLVIYDCEVDCFLKGSTADSCHLVEPVNNSIVFFPSHCDHAVLPVACDNTTFARFSINGWINQLIE